MTRHGMVQPPAAGVSLRQRIHACPWRLSTPTGVRTSSGPPTPRGGATKRSVRIHPRDSRRRSRHRRHQPQIEIPIASRLWPAGSFLGDFRTPAGARNSYMGMVNYKRASRRHCHVPLGQSVDPFDESVCVTRFANEPSPPYIRSGRMHLFHDPACGGFGPKRRNHSSAAAV